jgi:hypothetical protein
MCLLLGAARGGFEEHLQLYVLRMFSLVPGRAYPSTAHGNRRLIEPSIISDFLCKYYVSFDRRKYSVIIK